MEKEKSFSIKKRLKSTNHAWRGLGLFLKNTHNLWIHIFFSLLAVYLGFILEISNIEWVCIVFVIGLVFITEAFNTAIEINTDLTSSEYHPFARDTKDLSAGAVALSVIVAGIVGLIIFLPKIL
ncbi:diacylglycerol kinase family protein [Candidatus Nomurabacteria bacterium]|nr:diacylglycerol kinase family protein [Candidatus Nomurabacteria bacterium]